MVRFFSRRNWRGQRRWYFTVKARNGQPLCQSEGYNSPRARMQGLAALGQVFLDHPTTLPIHDEDYPLQG